MEVKAELNYRRIREIGIGEGMHSQVFEIEDTQLGGKLVAKEIPIDSFSNSIPDYFEEAKVMFASKHRNIVPIQYAVQRDGTHICLVMPYFEQGSLSSRIKFNPVSLKEVIRMGQDVLSGVSQIHAKGYLHLDIKPSNILFSDAGTPMLADFGQARALNENGIVTRLPNIYNYGIPPEVLSQRVATVESDIYQVGLTLYRAVNSDFIFHGQTPVIGCLDDVEELQFRILGGVLPNRNLFLPHVPSRLRNAITKALNVSSHKRFSSAIAFAEALGRINISCDWETTIEHGAGEIQWQACRSGKADLVVNLLSNDTVSSWGIEIFTERDGTNRRGANKDLWQKGLTQDEANEHLRRVFQELD